MAKRAVCFLFTYAFVAFIVFTAGCTSNNSSLSMNPELTHESELTIDQPLTIIGSNSDPAMNASGENFQSELTTMKTPAETLVSEVPTTVVTISPTPNSLTPSGEPFDVLAHFIPSGWMGNKDDIIIEAHENRTSHSPGECVRINYSAAAVRHGDTWAGIYWQYPENNWGNNSTGFNLKNYNRVSFWARGEIGGEQVEFKVGGIGPNVCYPDSQQPAMSIGTIMLTNDWREYQIDLSRSDLSHTIGGFCWVANQRNNKRGCTFYLDDVYYLSDEGVYGSVKE